MTWDPILAFVLAGAAAANFFGYNKVLQRSKPTFGDRFRVPPSTVIDRRLIGGSVIFGIGWGIAGFCPGASILALGTGHWEVAFSCCNGCRLCITPRSGTNAGGRCIVTKQAAEVNGITNKGVAFIFDQIRQRNSHCRKG